MPLAITEEQEQLADAVRRFAARHAPIDRTRETFDSIAKGEVPSWWADFVDQGFHAVHLPEEVGGQGGALADMACVVEAAATALLSGPLLSTVIASAVALSAGDTATVSPLVSELAAGATAAFVLPEHSDFRATTVGHGWRINGASEVTLGICSAQRIIVPARITGDELIWVVVNSEDVNVNVEPQRGTDLSTDVGVLHLADHLAEPAELLGGLDEQRVRCIAVTMTSCAAAGTVRWCVDAATEYIRTREQFGRPVGAFQALQHKAAALLVSADLAAAAAWDAARAAGEQLEQHQLASASAAVMAVAPAPELVLDALTMFGAIGYTWEHDLQLYWRRATSLAASLGTATSWARQMGELVGTHQRTSSLNLGDVEAAFRANIATVLDEALTLSNDGPSRQDERPEFDIGPRRDLLADAGVVAPHLPAPWGRYATPVQQVIITEEFDNRPELLRPRLGIADWILPTIIEAGSDTQRKRFAEQTLRGRVGWCQLFSEPGAGSDLASVTTRATKVDGGWRINGQKIWTSLADLSDFGALLARSDPESSKHRGLSYFLIDMTSPGIEIRPIKQATGRAEFNEVFFDDVLVPDDMLVGQAGDGWSLAIATMAHERTVISNFVTIDRAGALRRVVETAGADHDAVLRTLGEIDAYTNALKALVLRETLRLVEGQSPGPASSIAKFAYGVLLRRAAAATLGMTGRLAMLEDSDPAVFVPYFDLPAELIGGGTAEIQLTIIAQMILGLPRK